MNHGVNDQLGKASNVLRTIQAVAWSFVGLRQKSEFEKDSQQLNPIHLVIVGFVGVALFVGVLLLLVNWAVKTV
jgi:hypothetical protein